MPLSRAQNRCGGCGRARMGRTPSERGASCTRSISLPETVDAKLSDIMRRRGASRSAVIQRLIEQAGGAA